MPRSSPIEWPAKARIAISMLVSWETWPEDLGTPSSHQRSNRGRFPEKAVFKKFGSKYTVYKIETPAYIPSIKMLSIDLLKRFT